MVWVDIYIYTYNIPPLTYTPLIDQFKLGSDRLGLSRQVKQAMLQHRTAYCDKLVKVFLHHLEALRLAARGQRRSLRGHRYRCRQI